MDQDLLQKNFAKDLSNLDAIVNWASDVKKTGSFSDRRPDLGRMGVCPYCRVRRRANGPMCCSHPFAKDADGNDRSIEAMFGRTLLRKLKHKRHGQSKAFKIRELTRRFQHGWGGEEPLKKAAREMHVALPDLAGIPTFAEKFFAWSQEQTDRKLRRIARASRKINRGE